MQTSDVVKQVDSQWSMLLISHLRVPYSEWVFALWTLWRWLCSQSSWCWSQGTQLRLASSAITCTDTETNRNIFIFIYIYIFCKYSTKSWSESGRENNTQLHVKETREWRGRSAPACSAGMRMLSGTLITNPLWLYSRGSDVLTGLQTSLGALHRLAHAGNVCKLRTERLRMTAWVTATPPRATGRRDGTIFESARRGFPRYRLLSDVSHKTSGTGLRFSVTSSGIYCAETTCTLLKIVYWSILSPAEVSSGN